MINRIRNSRLSKLLWGLMGLFLLNVSVDSVDPNPEYLPEDLTINDQESIIEIVVEQVLGYEGAIEEYDDNDTQGTKKVNAKIDFMMGLSMSSSLFVLAREIVSQGFPDCVAYPASGFHQLDTPPPQI